VILLSQNDVTLDVIQSSDKVYVVSETEMNAEEWKMKQ